MLQLDLFEKDQITLILEYVKGMKQTNDSVRKSLFATINDLKKEVDELKTQVISKALEE